MPKQPFRPESFKLVDSIGYLVKRAQRAMRDRVELAFASQGITFQQWVVLMHLRDGLAGTIAELSREVQYDSGAMTRLIDQLEDRGFIERQRKAEDRRVVDLRLTTAGRKMAESLIPVAVDTLGTVLDGFSRAEITQLRELLRRIIDRASGEPPLELADVELKRSKP